MSNVERMMAAALAQAGDRYVLGAEAGYDDANPRRFDCSELVEWAAQRGGLRMPDGAWAQYQACRQAGTLVPVARGIATYGALLFVARGALRGNGGGNHVAFSLGNGRTIEARGRRYGVGSFSAHGRGWTHAGLVPGGDYSTAAPPRAPAPAPAPPAKLPFRKALTFGERGRLVEIAQWELAAATGYQFPAGTIGVYDLHLAQAVINLGRVLGKEWNGLMVGPDQWAAIDFLYLAKGQVPVTA